MGDWYGHHSRCSLSYGDGSKPKIPAWFYGVKTTVPSHPRWGVHGRFVLKVPETLQRFSVSSTPSAIILAFTAGRSDAALPFSTSSIAPISTLVTWGETRSNLRVISIWHQEGRKWGPSVMMFIYVQRIFFWIYQLCIATPLGIFSPTTWDNHKNSLICSWFLSQFQVHEFLVELLMQCWCRSIHPLWVRKCSVLRCLANGHFAMTCTIKLLPCTAIP